MPLTVVKGPPNSGRTEQVRRRYLELLPRRPILVVPGVDDIFGWERRFTEGDRALVGGQIVHFKDLFGEILELDKERRPEIASELKRMQLMRAAVREEWPAIAERLTDQPGMVDSLLQLVDDFRAELVDVETLEYRIRENDLWYLEKLSHVYRRYLTLLTGEGLTDLPREARRAHDRVADVWGDRPVLFAGFDEMTKLQLEVVNRLAFRAGAEVMVAVTHETDNPALALTDTLLAALLDLAPEGQVVTRTTRREDEDPPHDEVLLELEKRFLRPSRDTDRPLPETGALTIMRSTGERNEAEAIAAEIAALVSSGAGAGDIAVAIDAPAQNGRLLRDTLERFDIPVTLEAETHVRATVTGRSLLHLIAAAGPEDSAVDLLAFLRGPTGPPASVVDELERELRVGGIDSAARAGEILAGDSFAGRGAGHVSAWTDLIEAKDDGEAFAGVLADTAREIAMALLANDPSPVPSGAVITETQAATAIARACRELARRDESDRDLAAFAEALESRALKVWSVPAAGAVRIASPYSLRAKRVGFLFCAALQETSQGDTDRAGPFLSEKDRVALTMSPRRDPEVQQRYLFYSSLTVPTERLWLSCRDSDETGKTEHPSPLIAEVEALFDRDGEGRPLVRRGGRSGSEVTFDPGTAPTVDELARSLAALPDASLLEFAAAGAEEQPGKSIPDRLDAAASAEHRTRRLGSLTLAPVLAALGEGVVLGATEIESYAGCPYRWFIERQLRPQPFEPDPEHLAMGTLLHNTLEDLYRGHPGQIPRPDTLPTWLDELPILVSRNARSRRVNLGGGSVSHAAYRSRAVQIISAHLRRESEWENPRHLPARLEAKIGTRDAEIPPVPMGAWSLKGKIDRIDLSPETGTAVPREAVVIDYKSGSLEKASQKKARKERRFQVQLYLHAVREIWGAEPVAGLYVPLRMGVNPGRGAYSADLVEEMLERGISKEDKVENLDEFIAEGLSMADAAVADLMKGILDHDPATCPDHFDHPAVPDRPVPESEEIAAVSAR